MPTSTTRLDGLNRSLFYPGQRVCCALSGGADSTALLLALLQANAERESLGLVLSAIHIHHGLRGAEADADEAFVRDLCSTHNIPLTVVHVDTAARRLTEREGLEEAARELRYAAFRQLLAEGRADSIATAHTLDDQAETVLMKLLRGAWTEGLGGISPVLHLRAEPTGPGQSLSPASPTRTDQPPLIVLPEGKLRSGASASLPGESHSASVLRPLLSIPRTAIEQFLRERNQTWREDTSNADTSLTRNRVRHDLVPLLRSFNPSLASTLARTAELAREDQAYWDGEVARVLPGLFLPGKPVRGGGRAVATGPGEQSLAVEIERLRPYPPALRRRLLRAAARQLNCRLNAEETGKLLALAGLAAYEGLTARNGSRLDLGNGLRAERSVRELRLSRAPDLRIPKKV